MGGCDNCIKENKQLITIDAKCKHIYCETCFIYNYYKHLKKNDFKIKCCVQSDKDDAKTICNNKISENDILMYISESKVEEFVMKKLPELEGTSQKSKELDQEKQYKQLKVIIKIAIVLIFFVKIMSYLQKDNENVNSVSVELNKQFPEFNFDGYKLHKQIGLDTAGLKSVFLPPSKDNVKSNVQNAFNGIKLRSHQQGYRDQKDNLVEYILQNQGEYQCVNIEIQVDQTQDMKFGLVQNDLLLKNKYWFKNFKSQDQNKLKNKIITLFNSRGNILYPAQENEKTVQYNDSDNIVYDKLEICLSIYKNQKEGNFYNVDMRYILYQKPQDKKELTFYNLLLGFKDFLFNYVGQKNQLLEKRIIVEDIEDIDKDQFLLGVFFKKEKDTAVIFDNKIYQNNNKSKNKKKDDL